MRPRPAPGIRQHLGDLRRNRRLRSLDGLAPLARSTICCGTGAFTTPGQGRETLTNILACLRVAKIHNDSATVAVGNHRSRLVFSAFTASERARLIRIGIGGQHVQVVSNAAVANCCRGCGDPAPHGSTEPVGRTGRRPGIGSGGSPSDSTLVNAALESVQITPISSAFLQETNQLEVRVRPDQVQASMDAVGDFPSVTVLGVSVQPATCNTTLGHLTCTSPFRGGIWMSGCSGGFMVHSVTDNMPYILSAGHCTTSGDVDSKYGLRLSDLVQRLLGKSHKSIYIPSKGQDYGIVHLTNTASWGNGTNNSERPIQTGLSKRDTAIAADRCTSQARGMRLFQPS